MAKMYPPDRPASTKSNAERLLYPTFRDKLDDSYHVYHSRWWQFKYRTGETDFLVVHPDKGLIVVEIKGGIIEYDNVYDHWYSNSKKLNKSPYIQAEDTCRELIRFLKENYNFFKSRNFTYKFCVLFPDIDEVINLPNHGRGKTLTGNDLDNLQEKIEDLLDSLPTGKDKLGKNGLAELQKIIAPETEFIIYDINEIYRNDKLIQTFTDEQNIVLEELMDFSQVTILGCAGSGKTQLALAKTRELVRQKKRVLMTCKSDNLASFIYCSLEEYAKNKDDYSLQVARFHRIEYLLKKDISERCDEIHELLSKHEELKFDAIIIDEGQDFKAQEIKFLKKLLKHEQYSIFYIFQDDNQNIYKNILNNNIKIHPRKLITNLRNTRRIFKYFYPLVNENNRIKKIQGNEGPEVKQIKFENKEQLRLLLEQELQSLNNKRTPSSTISLLTNVDNHKESILAQISNLGGYELQYFNFEEYLKNNHYDKIKWSTVKEFKGLENNIICFLQEHPISYIPSQKDISNKYIGYSRAKWLLIDFMEREDF
ncbi:MAG: NERD domain-containing protein [Spirulina sp.]